MNKFSLNIIEKMLFGFFFAKFFRKTLAILISCCLAQRRLELIQLKIGKKDLLSDTKLAKNISKQFVVGYFSGNFS